MTPLTGQSYLSCSVRGYCAPYTLTQRAMPPVLLPDNLFQATGQLVLKTSLFFQIAPPEPSEKISIDDYSHIS